MIGKLKKIVSIVTGVVIAGAIEVAKQYNFYYFRVK